MDIGFLGGLRTRSGAEPGSAPAGLGAANAAGCWRWRQRDRELWLQTRGLENQVFLWGSLALLIRGYLRLAGTTEALNRERIAEELRWRYLEEGTVDLTGLEGNATLVLLDAQDGLVFLSRLPNSTNPIYYRPEADGLLFGSNLLALVEAPEVPPQPDRAAARSYLQTGDLSGRETLFQGCQRLLPGEMICWGPSGLQRSPYPEGANWSQTSLPFEELLVRIVADCFGQGPRPTNLLAGSLGSCGLQVLVHRLICGEELLPPTFSAGIDHSAHWSETEQTIEASAVLGTGHRLVPVEGSFATHLRQTLLAVAEPPEPWLVTLGCVAGALRSEGFGAALLDAPEHCLPQEQMEPCQLLARAAVAAGLMNYHGVDLLYPLFDSRLRAWLEQERQSHWLWPGSSRPSLRGELQRLLPAELAISGILPGSWTDWALEGGEPDSVLEQLRRLDPALLACVPREKSRLGQFLYRARCYSLWHELFIENGLPRSRRQATALAPASR